MAKVVVQENVERSRSPFAIPHSILGIMTVLALVAGLLGLKGFNRSPDRSGDQVPRVTLSSKVFVPAGPYGVGVTTLHLPASRGGAAVEVWYPVNRDQAYGTQASYDVRDVLPAAVLKLIKADAHVTYPLGGIEGAPVAEGRFPVALFSHGFSGFNTQSSELTSHVASWGFVVAAPEHQSRDLTSQIGMLFGTAKTYGPHPDVADLRATIDLLTQVNGQSGSAFEGSLDLSRIAAFGHSAGGKAAEELAVVDHRVKAFIGLAGASYGGWVKASGIDAVSPRVPGMIVAAQRDAVVECSEKAGCGASYTPYGRMLGAYAKLQTPKRFVGIANSGHLVFSDICALGAGRGGLVGVGLAAGLPIPEQLGRLGSDGCNGVPSTYLPYRAMGQGDFLAVAKAWPAINQVVVAQLRHGLGFDEGTQALDGLQQAFPGVVQRNLSQP